MPFPIHIERVTMNTRHFDVIYLQSLIIGSELHRQQDEIDCGHFIRRTNDNILHSEHNLSFDVLAPFARVRYVLRNNGRWAKKWLSKKGSNYTFRIVHTGVLV